MKNYGKSHCRGFIFICRQNLNFSSLQTVVQRHMIENMFDVCTCITHIHSFWTNRIIVRWCSSQSYSVSLARAPYIGRMKKISARHHRNWLNARSHRRTRSAYNIEEFSSSHFRLFKLPRCFRKPDGIATEKNQSAKSVVIFAVVAFVNRKFKI